jgi:hypothetical protein
MDAKFPGNLLGDKQDFKTGGMSCISPRPISSVRSRPNEVAYTA